MTLSMFQEMKNDVGISLYPRENQARPIRACVGCVLFYIAKSSRASDGTAGHGKAYELGLSYSTPTRTSASIVQLMDNVVWTYCAMPCQAVPCYVLSSPYRTARLKFTL